MVPAQGRAVLLLASPEPTATNCHPFPICQVLSIGILTPMKSNQIPESPVCLYPQIFRAQCQAPSAKHRAVQSRGWSYQTDKHFSLCSMNDERGLGLFCTQNHQTGAWPLGTQPAQTEMHAPASFAPSAAIS